MKSNPQENGKYDIQKRLK
uniref:Uncharacterized protein n=1 Tax=Arundo donax TaxID=35708 RepID=A0A0A9EL69_ARUDO